VLQRRCAQSGVLPLRSAAFPLVLLWGPAWVQAPSRPHSLKRGSTCQPSQPKRAACLLAVVGSCCRVCERCALEAPCRVSCRLVSVEWSGVQRCRAVRGMSRRGFQKHSLFPFFACIKDDYFKLEKKSFLFRVIVAVSRGPCAKLRLLAGFTTEFV
jgi:hypothetical protein